MQRQTKLWECRLGAIALALACCSGLASQAAEPPLILPKEILVGRNLQTGVIIHLGPLNPLQSAPKEGEEPSEEVQELPDKTPPIRVTIRSQSPSLKLALNPLDAGSSTITVMLAGRAKSGHFYIQAFADSGTATYEAEAAGFAPATGTVQFAPSGIVLSGPEQMALEGGVQKILLRTVALDPKSNLDPVCAQPLAGANPVTVTVRNQNQSVGIISSAGVIEVGSDTGVLEFTPSATGRTTVSVEQPPGWTSPGDMTRLEITVRRVEDEPEAVAVVP